MKYMILCLAGLLAACTTIELPGLVSDTVKAGKDIYQTVKQDGGKSPSNVLSNTAVGRDEQSVVQIKQQCIDEALRKLGQGNPRYRVLENEIGMLEQRLVAHCKLQINPQA